MTCGYSGRGTDHKQQKNNKSYSSRPKAVYELINLRTHGAETGKEIAFTLAADKLLWNDKDFWLACLFPATGWKANACESELKEQWQFDYF